MDLSDTLFETLRLIPRHISSPYVFTNPKTGTKYTNAFNNNGWQALLRRTGIESLRFHDLRHTFASRLAQAGVPLLAIMELMGHASITMTMRYAHLAPSNRRAAVLALDGKRPKSAHGGAHRSAQGGGGLGDERRSVVAVANSRAAKEFGTPGRIRTFDQRIKKPHNRL